MLATRTAAATAVVAIAAALVPPPQCDPGSPLPSFHITGLGTGPHDANAIFRYGNVWHLMHQSNWTDWAHLVSTDLVHWTRFPSVLSPNGDWDGTLTILDGEPVILFDCYDVADCLPEPHAEEWVSRRATQSTPNDRTIVGVARPVDLKDVNLTVWTKDSHNPIKIVHGGAPGAGPSNLWRVGSTINMLMTQRKGQLVRYQTNDATLHEWSIATPSPFYPGHGGSGVGIFHALPPSMRLASLSSMGGASHSATSTESPTHMLGGIRPPTGHALGTPWFALGIYRSMTGAFNATGPPVVLDHSELFVFGQVGVVDGSRMLHVGWFNGPGLSNCLTVPRDVTYDPMLRTLLAQPVPELRLLRGNVLGAFGPTHVQQGEAVSLFEHGTSANAFDLVIEVDLSHVQHRIVFSVAITTAERGPDTRVVLLLHVSVGTPTEAGSLAGILRQSRAVNVSASVPHTAVAAHNTSFGFQMPTTEASLSVRTLADRALAETFVASGRGAVTSPLLIPSNGSNLTLRVAFAAVEPSTGVMLRSALAWSMGCGWSTTI